MRTTTKKQNSGNNKRNKKAQVLWQVAEIVLILAAVGVGLYFLTTTSATAKNTFTDIGCKGLHGTCQAAMCDEGKDVGGGASLCGKGLYCCKESNLINIQLKEESTNVKNADSELLSFGSGTVKTIKDKAKPATDKLLVNFWVSEQTDSAAYCVLYYSTSLTELQKFPASNILWNGPCPQSSNDVYYDFDLSRISNWAGASMNVNIYGRPAQQQGTDLSTLSPIIKSSSVVLQR